MPLLFSLKHFWEKHICADEPPELDDLANYGPFIDRAAKMTNYHPALLLGIMNYAQRFNRTFKSPDDLVEYATPRIEKMSNIEIGQTILANMAHPKTPRPS